MKRNDIQRTTAGRRRVSCSRERATLYEGEGTAIDRGHSPHSSAHKDSPSATNPGSAMTCAASCRRNRQEWALGAWVGTLEGDAMERLQKEITSVGIASGM